MSSISQLSPRAVYVIVIAALTLGLMGTAAPTQAQAAGILVGAESNGELVNSNRTPELQAQVLDRMKAQGIQVVRANFGWNEIALGGCGAFVATPQLLADHANPCYNWHLLDSLVSQTNARGMKLLLSTSRAPVWLHGSTDVMYMGSTPAQVAHSGDHYAAFLAAAGARYGTGSAIGTVTYWTIWNEPNGDVFWHPKPNAAHYAMVYAKAAKALKSAHPGAQIAPGPTAPSGGKNGIKPTPFIKEFQKAIQRRLGSQTRSLINAWAHNPYPGNGAPHVTTGNNPDVIGLAGINKLFKVLDSHSSTKGLKVWATEFGYQTGSNAVDRSSAVSEALQARYLAEAYNYLASKQRVTIGIWYGFTDPTDPVDWQSGTVRMNGAAKPSYAMFQRMISVPEPAGGYRKGKAVQVWGRSNLNLSKGKIVMRKGTSGKWVTVPGQRKGADGSIIASAKLASATTQFAVYDGAYGMQRTIKAR